MDVRIRELELDVNETVELEQRILLGSPLFTVNRKRLDMQCHPSISYLLFVSCSV